MPDRPRIAGLPAGEEGGVAYAAVPASPAFADTVRPGLTGRVRLDVAADDTAEAFGSGDVPVLGTPRVVALCEQAAITALGAVLSDGQTSVGMRVQIDHLAPTAVGGAVTADATLEKIEGRRLTFTVSVSDRCGLVAAGRVTRVVVERERFLAKATG